VDRKLAASPSVSTIVSRSSRIAALVTSIVAILALAGGIVAAAVTSGSGGGVSLRCTAAGVGVGCVTSSTAPSGTTSAAATSTTRPPAVPTRLDDGSLGNRATRLACNLLSRAQIAAQFGGPVGDPTPTYPYCQWVVGRNSFLALAVEPRTSFDAATQYVSTLVPVHGLGRAAIIANNRYLYFTQGTTSFWLLWQSPGDFSSLNTTQLVRLGHDVLAHRLPGGNVPLPPSGPPGPPIYFAGDSTAAGPEWAWWALHENATTTRTLAEYQVGTGLVRPDFFDWPKHLLAVAAERRPKLVIWMGSANDGQEILVNGAYQAVGSRLWDAAYGATVVATMRSLVREGCKVLWIGEPAMQDATLNGYMQVIDRIFAEEAAKVPGVVFYNPGAVLNTRSGGYAGSLRIDGVLTPVRLDGIHLNIAGSEVLADALAPYVDRLLGLHTTKNAGHSSG
jgi:lysophospholipase L1-like esterase